MNKYLLLLLPFLCLSSLAAQGPKACEIKENNITVEGDVNGTLVYVEELETKQVICNGNCYFMSGGELRIIQDQVAPKSESRRAFRAVSPIDKRALVDKVVSNLPQEDAFCIGEFVADKIKANDFKVFTTENDNSVMVSIPLVQDDLERYGLQIAYEPVEGISRVWRMGQFHFEHAESGDCLTPASFGNGCERYDEATDFVDGSAIVKKNKPATRFWLINQKGQRITDEFLAVNTDKFAALKLLEIKRLSGEVQIIDRSGKQVSKQFNSLNEKKFAALGLIEAKKKDNTLSLLNSKGDEVSQGWQKLEMLGDKIKVYNGKWGLIEPFGDLVLAAEYDAINIIDKQYWSGQKAGYTHLISRLDAKSAYSVKGKAKVVPYDSYYVITVGDEQALFFPNSRKIGWGLTKREIVSVTPTYVHVKHYVEGQTGKKQQLLGLDGRAISEPYDDIETTADQKGFLKVRKGRNYGYIGRSGTNQIPVEYSYLGSFDPNFDKAWCVKEGKAGLLSRNGEGQLYLEIVNGGSKDHFSPIDPKTKVATFKRWNHQTIKVGIMSATHGLLTPNFDWHEGKAPIFTESVVPGTFIVEYSRYAKGQWNFILNNGERTTPDFKNQQLFHYNRWIMATTSQNKRLLISLKAPKTTSQIVYDQLGGGYSKQFDGEYSTVRLIAKINGQYQLLTIKDDQIVILATTTGKMNPFKTVITSVDCSENGTAFMDLDGNVSDCFPFKTTDMIKTGFRIYAIIKGDNGKFGLYDILNGDYAFALTLDQCTYDSDRQNFQASFNGQSFTFADQGRPIPTFISGDKEAFEAALRQH